jgi:hypothetical protein
MRRGGDAVIQGQVVRTSVGTSGAADFDSRILERQIRIASALAPIDAPFAVVDEFSRKKGILMLARIALILAALGALVTGCTALAQESVEPPGRLEHYQFVTATQLSPADLQSLIATRRALWEARFRGEARPSAERTPHECLVAEPTAWHGAYRPTRSSRFDQAETVSRLTDLLFWRNRIQVYNAVAVLQAEYSLAYDVDGDRGTMAGRTTEVFLKQNGTWCQAAWHWDIED